MATFNIQAGIGSRRPRHLLTYSHRYVLPHRQLLANLGLIAEQLADFDIVALQETDSGSFRTHHIHQAEYIAFKSGMPHCHTQVTRAISRVARISLGLLSRFPCIHLERHRLPASRHGRGLMEAVLNVHGRELAVFVTHLSLRQASRMRQMDFLIRRLNRHDSALLMGDLNCEPGSPEFRHLLAATRLSPPRHAPATFPSWRPARRLDHILGTPDIAFHGLSAMPFVCSDHLPVAATLSLQAATSPEPDHAPMPRQAMARAMQTTPQTGAAKTGQQKEER